MKNKILTLLEKLAIIKGRTNDPGNQKPDATELQILKELQEQYKLVKKLIVVKLDAIGDSLLFTNSLKALRTLFPAANITLACYYETKEIIDRCPYLDARVYFDRASMIDNKSYRENVFAKLHEFKFDVLLNLLYSREYIAEQIVAFLNADIKIGVKGNLSNIDPLILDVTNKWYSYLLKVDNSKNRFELERNAEIISLLGGDLDSGLLPELWESEKDNQFISQFLSNLEIENYAVVFPGSRGGKSSMRYWGTENYAATVDYIQETLKLKAVILGGIDDSEVCEDIAMTVKSRPIVLAGHFLLWQSVALLKHAKFYIGAETSMAHFTAALSIPTVVILGGGHYGRFFPYPNVKHVYSVYNKIECFNCNWKCSKKTVECIKHIPINEVISVCKDLVNKYYPSNAENNKDEKKLNYIKNIGSTLKIDLIVPPNNNHSWHLKEGWIHSLRKRGILNKLFYVDERNNKRFFDYVKTGGNSDAILALGGDHHLFFLHDIEEKRKLWNKYKREKICYSYESSIDTIYEMFRIRANNALKVFTHYLVADEKDLSIYKQSNKKAIWYPQFVDENLFNRFTPFENRKRSIFFKGKLINEMILRKIIIKHLIDSNLCTVVSEFLSTNELVNYYNSFMAVINPPGLFGGFNVRAFEALACGNILFQFKPQNRPLNNSLFEDGKHLFYFDAEHLSELSDKMRFLPKDLDYFKQVAEAGHAEVLNYHTLEKRVDTLVNWITENKLPVYPNYSNIKEDLLTKGKSQSHQNKYSLKDSSHKGLKIASDYSAELDLTRIDTESTFSKNIYNIFNENKPKKIIETGTYLGTGTTNIIASTIRDLSITDAIFYSIEVNPSNHNQAIINLANKGLIGYVKLLNGVSIPRELLPSYSDIKNNTVDNVEYDDIYVDHHENERAELYFNETNFNDVPEDLLGECLRKFDYKPDFVLLDSAGHMGFIEFKYLINRIQKECFIALDDIYHLKHYKSFLHIQKDPRFKIIVSSKEKFGFCIAKFTPVMKEGTQIINETKLKSDSEYISEAENAINDNNLSKARRYLNCALNISENNLNAKNNMAVVEILDKHYEKANDILNEILKTDSINKVAIKNMHVLNDILKQYV